MGILEQLRIQSGHSRDSLAAAADVTSRCVFSLEREGRIPRRKTAEALGRVLGVPAHVLRAPYNDGAPATNGRAGKEATDHAGRVNTA